MAQGERAFKYPLVELRHSDCSARRMTLAAARKRVESLLDGTGVHIDGDLPSDMQVRDGRLYARAIAHGSLGLGEAYMDGWWEADNLDEFLYRLLRAH